MTNKINILFVLNSLGTGGAERVVLDIARRLNRDKFIPYVIGINPPSELGILFKENNIWARCLRKGKGIDFLLIVEIYRIMRDKKIDIVNVHHFSPLIHTFIGSVLKDCHLCYTDHTVNEIRRIPLYWKIVGSLVLKKCFTAIGISHECTRELQNVFHISGKKTKTILNAIDLDRFKGNGIDLQAIKHELNLKTDETIIGMVANLRPEKNHANLLKACRIMLDMGKAIKILIVGEGPERAELECLALSLGIVGHVLFLGARHDVPELYKIMDVYCLCSHYEGLPLTILEAMASKLPVIGTDVDGIREIIKHEKTGILVDADNPSALADGLFRVLDDSSLSESIASNGYNYVQRNHDMIPWIKTYERLFSLPFEN